MLHGILTDISLLKLLVASEGAIHSEADILILQNDIRMTMKHAYTPNQHETVKTTSYNVLIPHKLLF